jgi:hypothetical protein
MLNPDTTKLSRRAALAGLAGAAATGAALPAAASVLGVDNPDAELLALATQFDLLYEEWRAHSIASRLDHVEFEAELVRRTGMTRAEAPPFWSNEGKQSQHPYWRAFDGIHEAGIANRFDCDDHTATMDELRPCADEILSYAAITREGLALQARAWMARYDDLWDSDPDDDPDYPLTRNFIENVCKFVGVPFPPYPMLKGIQLAASSSV